MHSLNETRRMCSACQKTCVHRIRVQADEIYLTCAECQHETSDFTTEKMYNVLLDVLGLQPESAESAVSESLPTVYVKHHLGEAEVSQETLAQHVSITGKIPEVGDALMALPCGIHHKAFAIRIGDVCRVTT